MFCPKCGTQVSDGTRLCPKCGYNIGVIGDVAQTPQPVPDTLLKRKLAQAEREGLGMKWYKFIIYVQCFLGGFSGLISSVGFISGQRYGDSASQVYEVFPGLKPVDMIYGIFSLVLAVLLVYTCFGLRKFKASSVNIYLFIFLANVLSLFFYLSAMGNIIHSAPFGSDYEAGRIIGTFIGNIGLFIANYRYFGRRKHLFNEA